MLDAHTEAGLVVGLPFSSPSPTYDFGKHGGMTARCVTSILADFCVYVCEKGGVSSPVEEIAGVAMGVGVGVGEGVGMGVGVGGRGRGRG